MNCLIWLLLLGCISGCGNNFGCAGGNPDNRRIGNGGREGRNGRRERPEGRGEECGGDAPGMIPPPWQEYPPMPPRRGENNDCGCGD